MPAAHPKAGDSERQAKTAAAKMHIRPAETDDAVEIAYIYNYYIATSHATFEIEPVDAVEMERRLDDARQNRYPFLVAEDNDEIVGYAYAHEYRVRCAYRQTIEVSVYVKPGHDGKRIGTTLYEQLLNEIRQRDFHTIVAGIALPNDASIALHEKFGFQKAAQFREVGRKFDRWIDVGYWQLVLDHDTISR
jgi:L-amino acid N-acyltransferase YncA